MVPEEIDTKIRQKILHFPASHRNDILEIWEKWIVTNPEPPYYLSWSNFSAEYDDEAVLFTERRVYLKRITNELKDIEMPKTLWQKVAKALAAVASLFFVIFMAISRLARATE